MHIDSARPLLLLFRRYHNGNPRSCRVFVDAVINHMAEQHTEGYGSAGSHYVADNFDFPLYHGDQFLSPKLNCPSLDGEPFSVG